MAVNKFKINTSEIPWWQRTTHIKVCTPRMSDVIRPVLPDLAIESAPDFGNYEATVTTCRTMLTSL